MLITIAMFTWCQVAVADGDVIIIWTEDDFDGFLLMLVMVTVTPSTGMMTVVVIC